MPNSSPCQDSPWTLLVFVALLETHLHLLLLADPLFSAVSLVELATSLSVFGSFMLSVLVFTWTILSRSLITTSTLVQLGRRQAGFRGPVSYEFATLVSIGSCVVSLRLIPHLGIYLESFQTIGPAFFGILVPPVASILTIGPVLWLFLFCPPRRRRMMFVALVGVAVGCWLWSLDNALDLEVTWRVLFLLAISLTALSILLTLHLAKSPRPVPAMWLGTGMALLAFSSTFASARVSEPASPPTHTAGLPNILIVLVDTLRADHTSLAGYEKPTTPFLEDLASNGATTFTDVTAPASATVPTVRSLFTSQLPSRWGLKRFSMHGPPAEEPHLPSLLRNSGYATAAVSANSLIDGLSFRRGFDFFWSASGLQWHQSSFFINNVLCFDNGLEVFKLASRNRLFKTRGETVRRLAYRWLREIRDSRRPFFLYLHLTEPHWPYYGHGHGLIPENLSEPAKPLRFTDALLYSRTDAQRLKNSNPGPLHQLIGRYDEEIRQSDLIIQGIVKDLETLDLLTDSLIIILSDHGEEFFEHDRFSHGHDVYQEQVSVPLVFKWPRLSNFTELQPVVADPISLLDVFPTIIDLLGLPTPRQPLHGASLRPHLTGLEARRSPGSFVITEALADGFYRVAGRHGRWKIRLEIVPGGSLRRDGMVRFFDLKSDPGEARPLNANGVPELEAIEESFRSTLQDFEIFRAETDLPAEIPDAPLERLRALGYVN